MVFFSLYLNPVDCEAGRYDFRRKGYHFTRNLHGRLPELIGRTNIDDEDVLFAGFESFVKL